MQRAARCPRGYDGDVQGWLRRDDTHDLVDRHSAFTIIRATIRFLFAETVQGAALAFLKVDDVHCCDGLPLGTLSVDDGVADDVLKEDLEGTPILLVDEAGDTL